MTYRGTVRNGIVELEPGATLPEGTQVQVTTVPAEHPADDDEKHPLRRYAKMSFDADLPPDLSEQHDHYLYGAPTRVLEPPAEPPLMKYARLARKTGLPSDFSVQHDHYIHGTTPR